MRLYQRLNGHERDNDNNDNKLQSPDVWQGLRGNLIKSLPEVKVGGPFD